MKMTKIKISGCFELQISQNVAKSEAQCSVSLSSCAMILCWLSTCPDKMGQL